MPWQRSWLKTRLMNQIFCDRSFAWFVNYFFAKCLEILTTGSIEIGKFLQKYSVAIFRSTAHALHLTEFFRILVPRAHDPSGLWQESRALALSNTGSPRFTDFPSNLANLIG